MSFRRMTVLGAKGSGSAAGIVSCSPGLPVGNQLVLAVSDEIGTSHFLQCFAQQRPVGGIVIAQEGLVQTPLFHAPG